MRGETSRWKITAQLVNRREQQATQCEEAARRVFNAASHARGHSCRVCTNINRRTTSACARHQPREFVKRGTSAGWLTEFKAWQNVAWSRSWFILHPKVYAVYLALVCTRTYSAQIGNVCLLWTLKIQHVLLQFQSADDAHRCVIDWHGLSTSQTIDMNIILTRLYSTFASISKTKPESKTA